MTITREDVIHTAKLARLELTEDEIVRFGDELSRITDYMAQLAEAVAGDTSSAPASPPTVSDTTLRADEIHPDSVGKTVLAHAPDSKGPFFRVPKVIE
jgi:aspartyl-tRNA(Asn)/glutamyl-tRNA(Gln) amidotransferase subunit C